MKKVKAAIIGPGNIGSDLMYKILRSDFLELELMAGIVVSEGIERARSLNVKTSINSPDAILENKEIKIVMVTVADDKLTRDKAFSLGANDFVKKPFTTDYLESVVMTKIQELAENTV